MSGVHKDGIGWNACGVYCGKCGKNTCKGCKDEFKPWKGLSRKTIERLKKEFNEDIKDE